MEISEINKVTASFRRSDSRGVSTTQHPFGERNMFTSLTKINHAWEYRNSPSRSFVFNDYSINDGGYFVCGILASVEVILVNSNSEDIEQITSADADRRDTDKLSNSPVRDRRFASKESESIIHHQVAIAFPTPRNQIFYRFGGL